MAIVRIYVIKVVIGIYDFVNSITLLSPLGYRFEFVHDQIITRECRHDPHPVPGRQPPGFPSPTDSYLEAKLDLM